MRTKQASIETQKEDENREDTYTAKGDIGMEEESLSHLHSEGATEFENDAELI